MRRRRIRLCSQTWHALAPGERRERRREGRRGGRSSRRNRHRHRRLRHRREERGGPHGGGSPPWRAHFDGVDPGGRCAWALELCPSWPDCRAAAPAQAACGYAQAPPLRRLRRRPSSSSPEDRPPDAGLIWLERLAGEGRRHGSRSSAPRRISCQSSASASASASSTTAASCRLLDLRRRR
ncbi:unnamed protein product [Urochloa humidicola]